MLDLIGFASVGYLAVGGLHLWARRHAVSSIVSALEYPNSVFFRFQMVMCWPFYALLDLGFFDRDDDEGEGDK